jgi:DNA-binding NarL/FixJ family response regulator
MKVQLAVSDFVVRQTLQRMLADQPDVVVLHDPGDAAAADVFVVDADGDHDDACAMIRSLKRVHPRTRAILVMMQPTAEAVQAALSAGASGVVSRAQPPRELLGALRVVAHGGSYLCPDVVPVS